MIENDTVKLLKECNAGVKMGVSSIDEVLDKVNNEKLKKLLDDCSKTHSQLGNDTAKILSTCHDEGKEPNPVAKGMSWVKTNMKMMVDNSDNTIADLMTDGCNMGVKSLSKYLNKYAAASEDSKNIAKQLIKCESDTAVNLREFL